MGKPSNSIWTRHRRVRRRWQFEISAALVVLTTAVAIKMALLVNQRAQAEPPRVSRVMSTPTAPRNCAQARREGVDNAVRGQEGYAPHLDRDNDGIACE